MIKYYYHLPTEFGRADFIISIYMFLNIKKLVCTILLFLLITWRRCLSSHKPRDSAVGFFHHANFFPSFIFCTRPDLARGRARQACPILVYWDRISGCAASRCIVHGRYETEDWAHRTVVVHNVVVHVTTVAHTERIVRIVRITGNSPFTDT